MKTVLAILVLCTCIYCCRSKAAEQQVNTSLLADALDSTDFQTTLEPLFRKNCSPCHFPGGKMYERMPFDQDSTIINHQAGILRRISKADERKLIKNYIEQGQKGNLSEGPFGELSTGPFGGNRN